MRKILKIASTLALFLAMLNVSAIQVNAANYTVTSTSLAIYKTVSTKMNAYFQPYNPLPSTPTKVIYVNTGTLVAVTGYAGPYLRTAENLFIKKTDLVIADFFKPSFSSYFGTTKTIFTRLMLTNKASVPVWELPSSNSLKNSTILASGTLVEIVGSLSKSIDNLWYKTKDGNWIYSGNLRRVEFLKPASGGVTSPYGWRPDPFNPTSGVQKFHTGIDYGALNGDYRIVATRDGVVSKVVPVSSTNTINGNYIQIDHSNGVVSGYYHLASFKVQVGQVVKQGEQIGVMGKTGAVTGVHLHFSIYVNGQSVNPATKIDYNKFVCTWTK